MDPFSLVVGIGSLVQISLQLAKCIKDVHDASASFEDDIEALLREIQSLESVNKSISNLYQTETGEYSAAHTELPPQEREVWETTVKTLHETTKTVAKL